MAHVELDAEKVRQSLNDTSNLLKESIDYMRDKKGRILLEVPEPYEHSIGPVSRASCLSVRDDCGDVGIMLGVFALMNEEPGKRK